MDWMTLLRWVLTMVPGFILGSIINYRLLSSIRRKGAKFNYTQRDLFFGVGVISILLGLSVNECLVSRSWSYRELRNAMGPHVLAILWLGVIHGLIGGRCYAILKERESESRWFMLVGIEYGIGIAWFCIQFSNLLVEFLWK